VRHLDHKTTCLVGPLCLLATVALGDNPSAIKPAGAVDHLLPVDRWTCVLANQTVTMRYSWSSQTRDVVSAAWHLTIGERTISFAIQMPAVKPGVVVAAELTVTLHTEKAASAVDRRAITIFSPDPFADRIEWLRGLNIRLFDPAGVTAASFEKQRIPFVAQPTLSSLNEVSSGIMVVGEGLNWKEHAAIASITCDAARRGVPVLCLAPSDGQISLKIEAATGHELIDRLLLAREDVVRRFDKRFDTLEWLGGESAICRLPLHSKEERLIAGVTDSSSGWPWLELHYRESVRAHERHELIICGLGIIKYWNEGPVPRYLLRAIFEQLQKKSPQHNEGFPNATP
jgi:hypothetical protein